jgi:hypothetical protein
MYIQLKLHESDLNPILHTLIISCPHFLQLQRCQRIGEPFLAPKTKNYLVHRILIYTTTKTMQKN